MARGNSSPRECVCVNTHKATTHWGKLSSGHVEIKTMGYDLCYSYQQYGNPQSWNNSLSWSGICHTLVEESKNEQRRFSDLFSPVYIPQSSKEDCFLTPEKNFFWLHWPLRVQIKVTAAESAIPTLITTYIGLEHYLLKDFGSEILFYSLIVPK